MSASGNLAVVIDALFIGSVGELPEGSASGIYKQSVSDRRHLDAQGVAGDSQADHDNHAGPERALHHYPAEHHRHWQRSFEDDGFVPGAFGENVSSRGVTEADVHVGDIFTIGNARIQLAQPRQPCWKPGARLGHKTMARDIVASGRAGWFYRVLEAGDIAAGDTLERIEAADHGITLTRFWEIANTRAPEGEVLKQMEFLCGYHALAEEWRERLKRRLPD